jgi:formylglycine-generating enzyme required for sulfatase activity
MNTSTTPTHSITIEYRARALACDDTGVWGGRTTASLSFDLPTSLGALLHALRCDEWYIEDRGDECSVDTVEPDLVGEWEPGEMSLIRRAAGETDDEEEPSPGDLELRLLNGDEIERVEVRTGDTVSELDPTVEAIVEWIQSTFGPIEPPEAFCEWASPLEGRDDLEVVHAMPDPTVVTNAAWRAQLVATALPWRIRHVRSGMEFVLVPPALGYFATEHGAAGEMRMSRSPFYIATTQVTIGAWHSLAGMAQPDGAPAHAVVTGFDATTQRVFLRKLGMRLPTVEEWEFACRAGTLGPAFGVLEEIAWSRDRMRARRPQGGMPVAGSLPPNGFGIHDMLGLAWEPCLDGQTTTLRGGSFREPESNCVVTARATMPESCSSTPVGLRPVIEVRLSAEGF